MKKGKMYQQKKNPRIKQLENEEKQSELNKVKMIPPKKCWVIEENRVGVFNVSAGLMEYCVWEVWQQLMSNFMITGVQISPDKKVFQFMAFSSLFEKHSRLEPDQKVAMYKIIIDAADPQKVKVKAEKMKESKVIGVPAGSKIVGADGKKLNI